VSLAALLALAAAACAAGAVVELASAPARPRRRGALAALLAALGRRVGTPRPAADLAERIEAAGAPLGLHAADVVAVKGGAGVLAPLAALPVAMALPGKLPLLACISVAAAGWLAPDWWLRRRARARARVMEAELPDVLDLLRVAVEAGLPVSRAPAEVARHHPGLLARELRRAAREHALGVPRATSLDALARRAPLPGVRALVAAIRRADRHGAPLGPALAALALEARADRARMAREAAARAAPKVQLVVAALLVPGAMLLIASALLGALTGDIGV
jgi:tight adherence protein C